MSPQDTSKIDGLFRTFVRGVRPLLLLDYDGTLAPFHVDRFQAVPWPGVRDLLNQIQEQGKTRMVVITGRPAPEIAPLLGLYEPVEVWGLHGFERLHPDGLREQQSLSEEVQQTLDALHSQLKRDSFGGLYEAKPNGAVMHWRGASPEQAAQIEQRTRAFFEPASRVEGFKLLPFEAGLELRAGRDKGEAMQLLLEEMDPNVPVAFLGDDLTDEAGFRALNGRGLSVLVRPEWRETAAQVWLKPPEELRDFLQRWNGAVEEAWGEKSILSL